MRIALALWALPFSAAAQASDLYLACNFSDGLRSNVAVVTPQAGAPSTKVR
jgi:hypothetical protein